FLLEKLRLSFSHAAGTWRVSGDVDVVICERKFQLSASYTQESGSQVLQLSTVMPAPIPIVDIPGIATLALSRVELKAARAAAATATASTGGRSSTSTTAPPVAWNLSSSGAFRVTEFIDVAGELAIFSKDDRAGLRFVPNAQEASQIHVPLPVPSTSNGQPSLTLSLGSLSLIRSAEQPQFVFSAGCDLS